MTGEFRDPIKSEGGRKREEEVGDLDDDSNGRNNDKTHPVTGSNCLLLLE